LLFKKTWAKVKNNYNSQIKHNEIHTYIRTPTHLIIKIITQKNLNILKNYSW
jgi:DNA mismatch repair ATPase MutS